MKTNRILVLLAVMATLPGVLSAQSTTSVPDQISYKGRVLDDNGDPVGAGGVATRTVIFRIWDHDSNTANANLIYSEQQTVTIAEGDFSVLIGQGAATSGTTYGYSETVKGPPTVSLANAFNGTPRYLGVTVSVGTTLVGSDSEISPRQRLVSTAYAIRAKFAESLGANGGTAMTVLNNGNTGVGNTNPSALFTVSGANTSTSTSNPQMIVTADDTTERLRIGVDSTGNGQSFLQSFKEGVGAQSLLLNPNGGRVGIGTSTPVAALEVRGPSVVNKGQLTVVDSVNSSGSVASAARITGWGNNINPDTNTTGQLWQIGSYSESGHDVTFNNPNSANMYLGTNNKVQLALQADGSIFLNGINNPTSAAMLEIRSPNTGGYGLRHSNGTTSLQTYVSSTSANLYSSSALALSTGAASFTVKTNSTQRMEITSAGNVGIGTTTAPDHRLTIQGSTWLGLRNAAGTTKWFINENSGSGFNMVEASGSLSRLYLQNGGNVGIGTTSPAFNLHVQDLGANTGRVHVGSRIAGADAKLVSFGDSDYVMLGEAGADDRMELTATNFHFKNNNGTGAVGIGIAPTKAKLEVNGITGGITAPGFGLYTNAAATNQYSTASTFTGGLSLYCSGRAVALDFLAPSDQRIKNIVGVSDAVRDLDTLMGIEITDYTYIDKVNKGAATHKKVIAQQLETVYPQAVSRGTDEVPDIFKMAAIQDGWIVLATDLKKGDRVKLVGEKQEGIHEVLEVEKGRFRADYAADADKVFVYGREVKDFRTVDYEAVSMLNVSATQQLARLMKVKDTEVKELKQEQAGLEKRLGAVEAEDKALEARLATLEKRLHANDKPTVRTASLTRSAE